MTGLDGIVKLKTYQNCRTELKKIKVKWCNCNLPKENDI